MTNTTTLDRETQLDETVRIVGRLEDGAEREEVFAFLAVQLADFPTLSSPRPVLSPDRAGCPGLRPFFEVRGPVGPAVDFAQEINAMQSHVEGPRVVGHLEVQTDPRVGPTDPATIHHPCSWTAYDPPGTASDNRAHLPTGVRRGQQVDPPPSFHSLQHYLGPASIRCYGGIEVATAWSVEGGDGAGVQVADVEYAWDVHCDLPNAKHFPATAGHVRRSHGLAVEGVVAATHDGRGTDGIAPAVAFRPFPVGSKDAQNVADAVCSAASELSAGDVILLEVETQLVLKDGDGDCFTPLLPYELTKDVFAAIQDAIRRGIHVVQAAGNGAQHLDGYRPANSGALLVAGGQPSSGLRTADSNWGSRVDFFSWGNSVLGPDLWDAADPFDQPHWPSEGCAYDWFGGSSAAAAIVAGCVAVLSGIARHHGSSLSPAAMRDLLKDTGYSKELSKPDEIGVHPNLRTACLELQRRGIIPAGSVIA